MHYSTLLAAFLQDNDVCVGRHLDLSWLSTQQNLRAKAAKSLSSAWLLYPTWGSAWGPGWRRCRGQRNVISTGPFKRGSVVRALDFEVKRLNGSSGIWQGWNFSSELRKGRRRQQRELKVRSRTRACQGCQHKALQAEAMWQAKCLSHSVRCASHYVYLLMSNTVDQFYLTTFD